MHSSTSERYLDPSQKERPVGGEISSGLLSSSFHSPTAQPGAISVTVRPIAMQPRLATALRNMEQGGGLREGFGGRFGKAAAGGPAGPEISVGASYWASLLRKQRNFRIHAMGAQTGVLGSTHGRGARAISQGAQ